jgi:hypothetical protein
MATTESSTYSKPRSRWRVRLTWAAAILVLALVLGDYVTYQAAKQQALAVVFEIGGKAGSIGGWPFGEEDVITFQRDLSADELQRLTVLNRLSGRHHTVLYFKDCKLSESRMAEIRRQLSGCQVYLEEMKDQQRLPAKPAARDAFVSGAEQVSIGE